MENYILKFNRKSKNPIEFIKNLKKYMKQIQEKQIKGRKGIIDVKGIIDRAMENNAGMWWQTIRAEIENLEEFIQRFKEKY